MNTANSLQNASNLRIVAFPDVKIDKHYFVKIGTHDTPFVAKVIEKDGDSVTVYFIEDEYQEKIDKGQLNGTYTPKYEFSVPGSAGGRRKTRRRRSSLRKKRN
jgi:hypothetical protein